MKYDPITPNDIACTLEGMVAAGILPAILATELGDDGDLLEVGIASAEASDGDSLLLVLEDGARFRITIETIR